MLVIPPPMPHNDTSGSCGFELANDQEGIKLSKQSLGLKNVLSCLNSAVCGKVPAR